MFEERPPPILRGDLFTLLDPEGGGKDPTPGRVAQAAQRLVSRVQAGKRTAGAPVVMQCLQELAALSDGHDPMRAFWALTSIRQRLVALGHATARELPFPLASRRVLVLPQPGAASVQVVRALKAGGDRDVWFVVTREVTPLAVEPPELVAEGRPPLPDSACGPILHPVAGATHRLFRFGERASDIRMVSRVTQEAGRLVDVQAATDGVRVALLSRHVIAIFDADGHPELDADVDKNAEVTAMALAGNILGLNLRAAKERPVELALIAIDERKGFPVGVVGDDAGGLVLGERAAYVLDGVHLVRLPLFTTGEAEVRVFSLRPWFAEYPWTTRLIGTWDGRRVWISNGRKLVVIDEDLAEVRAEIVLPEPIVDFAVYGGMLHLVHFEEALGRLRIGRYALEEG